MRRTLFLIAIFAIVLAACEGSATPTSSSRLSIADVYYVELDGDDTNFCDSPAEACRTIEGALARASDASDHFDEIYIGTGTFSAERVFVRKNISFIGAGIGDTIIQGSADLGAALISPDPVRVVFRDLTVTNAGPGASGVEAALYFTDPDAELILRRVHLFANNTHGVQTGAPFHIQDSIFEDNRGDPIGGVSGAGLIERSQFLNNIGSAILTAGGDLTILDSYFEGNQADNGSAINGSSHAAIHVERSTFTLNRPVGDPLVPTVIWQQNGSLSLLNVTVSGNPMAVGVYANYAELDITFSTFVDNMQGLNLYVGNTGRVQNNLIGNNLSLDCLNVSEPLSTRDNIVATRNGRCSGPIDRIDIGVGPLQDNGGLTPTHALLEGSPGSRAPSAWPAMRALTKPQVSSPAWKIAD